MWLRMILKGQLPEGPISGEVSISPILNAHPTLHPQEHHSQIPEDALIHCSLDGNSLTIQQRHGGYCVRVFTCGTSGRPMKLYDSPSPRLIVRRW